jgi:CheY-like chemotaxis protein
MLGNYKILFADQKKSSTRDLGISRITIHLAMSLLSLLSGKFEVIELGKDKSDCRFVFPLEVQNAVLVEPQEVPVPEFKRTEIADIVVEPKVEEQPEEPVPAEPLHEEEHVEEEIQVEKHFVEPAKKPDLPLTAKKSAAKVPSGFSISSLSCLYIEDQVDSQILFKVQMKELKEIKFAVSFEEALPLLNNFHFDFLVIDINLQGEYNGLDALRIIHKMPGLEEIPIIAVTAYVLPGDREKFIASGFNDFISKPIFHEKMVDVLSKIFIPNA